MFEFFSLFNNKKSKTTNETTNEKTVKVLNVLESNITSNLEMVTKSSIVNKTETNVS